MKRFHLFEFEDQAWLPPSIHSGVIAFLQFAVSRIDLYKSVAGLLDDAIRQSGARRVLDLCAGAGGPWLEMREHLQVVKSAQVTVCLTDLYPDPASLGRFKALDSRTFDYVEQPVSALAVPPGLGGFRTLFSSFHHFREEQALRIIADAVENGHGLGVMESTQRHPLMITYMLLTPLIVLLTAPFHHAPSWKRLFWTYVLPVVPLIVMFDGIVSCLRTYTPAELLALVERVPNSASFHWRSGVRRLGFLPVGTTYLLGWPKQARAADPVS